MRARRLTLPLALAALLPLARAGAQPIVVTSPAGLTSTSDPFPGFFTWYRDDVRNTATAGITNTYPRSGNGSMYLSGQGSSDKANVAYYFDPSIYQFTMLGNIGGAMYDYYRDGSSTAAGHLAPAMRLLVDADGNIGTSGDRLSLIYEPIYNGVGTVATNAWTSVMIGTTTNLWVFQTGQGVETVYNRTLADYQAGTYSPSPGFAQVSANSLVYGLSLGTGSGWSGTFAGAIDNVGLQFNSSPVGPTTVSWNFETEAAPPSTTTPEPASFALLGSGLLALGGAVRRRRASA